MTGVTATDHYMYTVLVTEHNRTMHGLDFWNSGMEIILDSQFRKSGILNSIVMHVIVQYG